MKHWQDCNEVLRESGWMTNVLSWYPSKHDGSCLYVGTDFEVFAGVLPEDTTVIRKAEAIPDKNNCFQTIVLDHVLDKEKNKSYIIRRCYDLLKRDGALLILAENKLGAKRLFRSVAVTVSSNPYELNWKEWKQLLSHLDLPFQVYYPYPEAKLAELIFLETPHAGDLPLKFFDYEGPAYHSPDENMFMREMVRNDYFPDFNNSFLFIVGKPSSVEYVKFSRDRYPQYQIQTSIEKLSDGTREVIKSMASNVSANHLERMDIFKSYITPYETNQLKYCPVNLTDGSAKFPFIQGASLEKKLSDAVNGNNMKEIQRILGIVSSAVNMGKRIPFTVTTGFHKVFGEGNYDLLSAEIALEQSNMDLVPANFIESDDDSCTIIDYEWTFAFPIPQKYVLFRSLIHSIAFSKLCEEEKNVFWQQKQITPELQNLFWNMEAHFQSYIASTPLNKKFEAAGGFPVPFPAVSSQLIECGIEQDDELQKRYYLQQPDLTVEAKIQKHVSLDLCFYGNMRTDIKSICIDGKPVRFSTNADLAVGDHYIFCNPPVIHVESPQGTELKAELLVYNYADPDVDTVLNLMNANHNINHLLKDANNGFRSLKPSIWRRLARKWRSK